MGLAARPRRQGKGKGKEKAVRAAALVVARYMVRIHMTSPRYY